MEAIIHNIRREYAWQTLGVIYNYHSSQCVCNTLHVQGAMSNEGMAIKSKMPSTLSYAIEYLTLNVLS